MSSAAGELVKSLFCFKIYYDAGPERYIPNDRTIHVTKDGVWRKSAKALAREKARARLLPYENAPLLPPFPPDLREVLRAQESGLPIKLALPKVEEVKPAPAEPAVCTCNQLPPANTAPPKVEEAKPAPAEPAVCPCNQPPSAKCAPPKVKKTSSAPTAPSVCPCNTPPPPPPSCSCTCNTPVPAPSPPLPSTTRRSNQKKKQPSQARNMDDGTQSDTPKKVKDVPPTSKKSRAGKGNSQKPTDTPAIDAQAIAKKQEPKAQKAKVGKSNKKAKDPQVRAKKGKKALGNKNDRNMAHETGSKLTEVTSDESSSTASTSTESTSTASTSTVSTSTASTSTASTGSNTDNPFTETLSYVPPISYDSPAELGTAKRKAEAGKRAKDQDKAGRHPSTAKRSKSRSASPLKSSLHRSSDTESSGGGSKRVSWAQPESSTMGSARRQSHQNSGRESGSVIDPDDNQRVFYTRTPVYRKQSFSNLGVLNQDLWYVAEKNRKEKAREDRLASQPISAWRGRNRWSDARMYQPKERPGAAAEKVDRVVATGSKRQTQNKGRGPSNSGTNDNHKSASTADQHQGGRQDSSSLAGQYWGDKSDSRNQSRTQATNRWVNENWQNSQGTRVSPWDQPIDSGATSTWNQGGWSTSDRNTIPASGRNSSRNQNSWPNSNRRTIPTTGHSSNQNQNCWQNLGRQNNSPSSHNSTRNQSDWQHPNRQTISPSSHNSNWNQNGGQRSTWQTNSPSGHKPSWNQDGYQNLNRSGSSVSSKRQSWKQDNQHIRNRPGGPNANKRPDWDQDGEQSSSTSSSSSDRLASDRKGKGKASRRQHWDSSSSSDSDESDKPDPATRRHAFRPGSRDRGHQDDGNKGRRQKTGPSTAATVNKNDESRGRKRSATPMGSQEPGRLHGRNESQRHSSGSTDRARHHSGSSILRERQRSPYLRSGRRVSFDLPSATSDDSQGDTLRGDEEW